MVQTDDQLKPISSSSPIKKVGCNDNWSNVNRPNDNWPKCRGVKVHVRVCGSIQNFRLKLFVPLTNDDANIIVSDPQMNHPFTFNQFIAIIIFH
jgi:hypothetical protein